MINWKIHLVSGESQLGVVNIRRGIFPGNLLSPFLFVVALDYACTLKIEVKIFMWQSKRKDKSPTFYGRPEFLWL